MSTQADRRRFNGPEGSSPIAFKHKEEVTPLLSKETGLRADGRKLDELRPIYLRTGLVPQANGSAYIETGKTKIVCAVYGPHPTRKDAPYSPRAKLNVEVKFAPFACPGERRAPGKDTESPFLSNQLSQALLPALRLDLLPKSAIDIYLTILESDGPQDDISTGVTAASVAMAEAGVEMFGLVVGCCAMLSTVDEQAVILLDPTCSETRQSGGTLSFTCMPALSSTTNISFTGSVQRQHFKQTLAAMQETCAQIHGVAAKALLEAHDVKRKTDSPHPQ